MTRMDGTLLSLLMVVGGSSLGCGGGTAKGVTKAYLTQQNCANRLPSILDPELNRSALLDFYKAPGKTCDNDVDTVDDGACKDVPEGGYCTVPVTFKKVSPNTFELKKTSSGFKVDWRAAIGYNPLSIAAFKAQHAPWLTDLRVEAKVDTIYTRDDALGVSLRDQNGDLLHGYSAKARQSTADLMKVLQDGKGHRIMVRVIYPAGSKDAGDVDILNLVEDGWHQTDGEAKGAPPTAASGVESTTTPGK